MSTEIERRECCPFIRKPRIPRMQRTPKCSGDLLRCPPLPYVFEVVLPVSRASNQGVWGVFGCSFHGNSCETIGGRIQHRRVEISAFYCAVVLASGPSIRVCKVFMDAPFSDGSNDTVSGHVRPWRPEISPFLCHSTYSYSWQLSSSMALVFWRQNRHLLSHRFTYSFWGGADA